MKKFIEIPINVTGFVMRLIAMIFVIFVFYLPMFLVGMSKEAIRHGYIDGKDNFNEF